MQIDVVPEQVQPLPFYQVRVIWDNAEKLQKASLDTRWENNLQQQSVRQFKVLTDDKATCDRLASTLQNKPDLFTSSIVLQYSLSASKTATRILSVKTDHFLNSKLMATLKSMDVQSPERYVTSDDANRLGLEITDNVVASQVVDDEYVPDTDMLTLKDIVTNALQSQNVDVGNFTSIMWESVFWDPSYSRPDKVTSYLNKVLNVNQGNHTVSKSSAYTDKDDDGINFGMGGFTFGGKTGSDSSGSSSFAEMQAWLLQHNYDVEIKGELFVPKNRQLTKLNLGVLNRQEVIYTKSVQMHHIDAPGHLTVTVGQKSLAESEDIKMLRQNTNALVSRLDQLEPRVAQLEPKMDSALAQDGQLNAKIDQVNAALSGALGTKISSCQLCVKPGPDPNAPTGPEQCTSWSNTAGWGSGWYCRGDGCSFILRCQP